MEYAAIKASLSSPQAVQASSFALLREIARFVNQRSTHNEGRDLVIRALAVGDAFPEAEQEILTSLVRSVGLFPYMTSQLGAADLDDYLAYELHRADNMDGEIVFHSLQAKIFHQLMSGANVVLSASTSVGKSLVIDALVASEKYRKIVVIVPTIALIDETRRRLLGRFGDRCAVVTHPTQEADLDKLNVYVLTQERVLQRDDLMDTQLFIVDEFYKVNLAGESNSDRAVDLNLAFNKLVHTGAQFYLLGPNIQAIKGLEAYEYHFIPSEFSTVAVDVVNYNLPTRGEERNLKLVELLKTVDGPTIIYCQSPGIATKVATLLAESGFPLSEAAAPAVEWMADRYHPDWSVCKALAHGIGVHHGGVPRALQQYFIRLFNERKINHLVCQSTIIEGVNTVAKNVIIYDRRKSKDVLDHFTYKNIEGRAGRMREYFIGRVFVLESAPSDEAFSVEFPIGAQGPKTPLGLLLELEDGDLTPASRQRLKSLFEESTLSPETLRANRHTPIELQERIARQIRNNPVQYKNLLPWTGVPSGPELQTVCALVFDYLEGDLLREYRVFSASSLAWHLNTLRTGRDLSAYIARLLSGRFEGETPGDAVERGLKFIRNVVCQRFPRDLMVIDAIQREVFNQQGIKPGDYALFAEQTENLFMPSALFALDEYGVPVQTAQRLRSQLLPATTLNVVLERLARLDLTQLDLTTFEVDLLSEVRRLATPSRSRRTPS
jgi:DEAD/DEAH box helicase